MYKHISTSVATFGLLAVLITALPARADDEADRVREIESSLAKIKDKLSDIAAKSSSSDIEEAIRESYRVKEYADHLHSMKAQSEPGKTMGDSYPDWVDKFQESMHSLKDMKDAQLKADNDKFGERCKAADTDLRSLVKKALSQKDANGLVDIPTQADKLRNSFGSELKNMKDKRSQMDNWRSSARNFSASHQKWSDVKDRLQSAANEIWERWNKQMESAGACEDLAKGNDNPLVKEAVEKLGTQNKRLTDTYKELKTSYRNWLKDLNSFRDAARQDARELYDLYCNDLEWEARSQQVAEKYASQLRPQWTQLTGDRDRMLDKADLLVSLGSTNAPKAKRLIVQAWDKVEIVKDGQLQGANNPFVRAQIEKGKAEHKSRQSGKDMQNVYITPCDNPDKTRGSKCFADYIDGCTLYEIKPNNKAAVQMGEAQARAYTAGLAAIFETNQGKDKGQQSAMFSMESGRYSKLAKCVVGSSPGSYSLKLAMQIDSYGFCPGDPDNMFPPLPPIPSEDLPDNPMD